MSLAQTKAASLLEADQEMNSHRVISLLMDGALERAVQAKTCLSDGKGQDAEILVAKLIGIINGLRGSLNMEAGGEIATNLDSLYAYMVNRLDQPHQDALILAEVEQLISELKSGWDEMEQPIKQAG